MGGIAPMWRDVLYCHEQRPIHVMIGGGDQLYCDDVWNLPALAQWLQLPELAQRLAHPFTQDMADQVEWFYFTSYVKHWSQDKFSVALGSIPQVRGLEGSTRGYCIQYPNPYPTINPPSFSSASGHGLG